MYAELNNVIKSFVHFIKKSYIVNVHKFQEFEQLQCFEQLRNNIFFPHYIDSTKCRNILIGKIGFMFFFNRIKQIFHKLHF